MSLEIRIYNNLNGKAEEFDFEGVSDLIKVTVESIQRERRGNYADNLIQNMLDANSPEKIREIAKNSCFWLVYDGEDLIGCSAVFREEEYFEGKKTYIHPNYQGRKVGTRLLSAMGDFVLSLGAKELYGRALNYSSTLEFYESHGCTKVRDIEVDYNGLKLPMVLIKKELK